MMCIRRRLMSHRNPAALNCTTRCLFQLPPALVSIILEAASIAEEAAIVLQSGDTGSTCSCFSPLTLQALKPIQGRSHPGAAFCRSTGGRAASSADVGLNAPSLAPVHLSKQLLAGTAGSSSGRENSSSSSSCSNTYSAQPPG